MERVNASKFKAKLGQYMRAARQGRSVLVTDRDQPVARLVPARDAEPASCGALVVTPREATAPPLGQVEVAAIDYRGPSTTDLLVEDRSRR